MKDLEHESDRNKAPITWLATVKAEIVELREMLKEATAEAAERADTVSGRREATALLGTIYRHSVSNHHIAKRASEVADAELTTVLSEMQQVIEDAIVRLEQILAASPDSARTHSKSAYQVRVQQ